ncbi:HAD family hydrolase [Lactonifactor longoviformis]|uniref:HAD family hydrolase n=1 Tax=Lactonifactor longoviformis TaxID=341220 RepID=UPI0036F30012
MNKAIFWDFDGTLVHSQHLWSNAIYETLLHYIPDTPVTFEEIRAMTFDLYPWDTPNADFTQITGSRWWKHMERRFSDKYVEAGVPLDTAQQASTHIREKILQKEKYHLYEDTLSVLDACRMLGYRNYILSNNYPELPEMAKALGLTSFFDGIIVSGLVGYDKPRREIFQIALETADFPEVCYMVGDNPVADIQGARQMKIPGILVHRGEHPDADHCLDTLTQLLSIPGFR